MELRTATPGDARALAANVAEGFLSYREWAPQGWSPPVLGERAARRLAERLSHPDAWCLMALEQETLAGHVGMGAITAEDPDPAPAGTTNLWQLFVRPPWQGRGLAATLLTAAIAEARRRGFQTMRLWTPRGAARARRFYEREGWTLTGAIHESTPSGLATVQYARALEPAG